MVSLVFKARKANNVRCSEIINCASTLRIVMSKSSVTQIIYLFGFLNNPCISRDTLKRVSERAITVALNPVP